MHLSDQVHEAMAVGIAVKKAIQSCPEEPQNYNIRSIEIERITRIEYEDRISESKGPQAL